MSLTAGWRVELGVGDPGNIPGTGVYDTATYAAIDFQGNWVYTTFGGSGMFNFANTLLTLSVFDDAATDRSSEMLAAPDPVPVEFVGTTHSSTWLLSDRGQLGQVISYHVQYLAGDTHVVDGVQVPLFDISEVVDIRWLEEVPVYGSDAEFGYLTDVTSFVEELRTRRGRERYTSRFRTGVASVVFDDTLGVFTPPAGVSPTLGFLALRPGRSIRISHEQATVFSGFVDSFDSRTTRDGNVRSVVKCSDSFAAFNRNQVVAVDPEGAGDPTPTRMNRLLDHYLSDGRRVQFRGDPQMTMSATTMNGSLLNELQLTAESEGGGCWIDVSGNVTGSAFSYFSDKALEPPTWLVGGVSPIKILSTDSAWELHRIINEAHMARSGGSEQVTVNTESQALYGRRTHTRLDLYNENDTQVQMIAQRLVDFAGVDRQRITELQFLPEPGTDAAMMCVAADFGDVFQVTVETLFGWAYTVVTALFGIEHTVNADRWLTTLRTDDTEFEPVRAAFQRASFDNEAFS